MDIGDHTLSLLPVSSKSSGRSQLLPANSLHWKVEKSESNDIEALHLEKPKFSDKCRSKNLIPGKPKMKLSDKDIVQGGEWSSLSP